MLLRNSICNTKKFFQKTLQSFKSLFSCGHYQKLPKNPPYNNPYSCSVGHDMNDQTSYKDLEKFYNDFTDRWDSDKDKTNRRSKKKTIPTSPTQQQEVINGSFIEYAKTTPVKNYQMERKENHHHHHHYKMKSVYEGKRHEDSCSNKGTRDGRTFLVAQKLKELEMMDMSNVDHVLDIEEVLHYYSRLSCPAYLDIVDKFFMDMYTEFFGPPATPRSVNSRPKLRSAMRSQTF